MNAIHLKKAVIAFVLLSLFAVMGCAREERTVRKEVVTPGATATTTSGTTTVVEKEVIEKEESTSVIGTIFDVIGEVIAVPFRLVAGIFRFVF